MSLKGSGYPTIRSTLDLRLAQLKRVDPSVSFSRSSTGTYVDADGVIREAATNQPRFDHNPSTGESLGLLVEEARTNEMSLSVIRPDNNGFYTQWTPTDGATIQPYAALAPDGTFTAALVTFPNSGVPRVNRQTTVASGTRMVSCWVRAKTGTVKIRIGNNSDFGQDQTIGTEWTRILQQTADSTNFAGIYVSSPVSSAEFYAWGFQQEAGSFPTSYIPTPATFTSRASTATYYDANGVIQTAAIDVARDNAYFPDSSGVMRPAGLLLEAEGTNLCTQSETFTGSPFTLQGATASKTQVAPDGSTNATLITLTAENTTHRVRESISTNRVTRSFFVKKSNCRYVYILDNNGGYYGPSYKIDLDTGSITLIRNSNLNSNPNYGFGISKFPNGYYRVWFDAVQIDLWGMYPSNIDYSVGQSIPVVFNADGTEQFIIWGYQVETSSLYSTSYIPTAGSTVTRAADVSSSSTKTRNADVVTIPGIDSNIKSATARFRSPAAGTSGILGLDDGTANNRVELLTSGTDSKLLVTTAGSAVADLSGGTIAANVNTGIASRFALNNFAVSVAGGAEVTDTSGTPPAFSTLRIGSTQAGARLNGTISKVRLWSQPLSSLPGASI